MLTCKACTMYLPDTSYKYYESSNIFKASFYCGNMQIIMYFTSTLRLIKLYKRIERSEVHAEGSPLGGCTNTHRTIPVALLRVSTRQRREAAFI